MQKRYNKKVGEGNDLFIDYVIYYQQSDEKYRMYHYKQRTFETVDKLPKDKNKFFMMSSENKEPTDQDLKDYGKDFKEWNKELKYNKIFKFKYGESYSDDTAVTRLFKLFCLKNYKDHDVISAKEHRYFELCNNGGLQNLSKSDITVQSYGYDLKQAYATILNSENLIPCKVGKECTLEKLPKMDKLKHGFYHVKITCDNSNFRKIFSFSKHNMYLNVSLAFAMRHQQQFNVKIELIHNDQPNAYLYRKKDMVTLNSICSEWFDTLTSLRREFPKNPLIKHALSSVTNRMNGFNYAYKTLKEINDQNLDVGIAEDDDFQILELHDDENIEPYYKLLNTKSPYKNNIRLKSWVTAICRNKIAEIALRNIDAVIRIQTDCVTFSEEMVFEQSDLVVEEKTTGLVHWINVNSYHNQTNDYKTGGYKRKGYDVDLKHG